MPKEFVEDYVDGWDELDNPQLLVRRDDQFTPAHQFTATYAAEIEGLNVPFKTFVQLYDPTGVVKVLDSNFGHKAQPGYEDKIKQPKKKSERKVQGDGSCFNSCVEARLEREGETELRHVKCFPTRGGVQVVGCRESDCSDGIWNIERWVEYLNEQLKPEKPFTFSGAPQLVNVNFRLRKSCPRMVFDLLAIAGFFDACKLFWAHETAPKAALEAASGSEPSIPKSHYEELIKLAIKKFEEFGIPTVKRKDILLAVVDEQKNHDIGKIEQVQLKQGNTRLSLKFAYEYPNGKKTVSFEVFLSGKVNILGLLSFESGSELRDYFVDILQRRWDLLVKLIPETDAQRERRERRVARRANTK